MCLALGIAVLWHNRKATLNRLFFWVIFTGFVYSFTTVMMWSASTAEDALLWHKLGTMWPLFAAATLHFALVFTNNRWITNRIHCVALYIALYTPAVLFWIIDATTNLINTPPIQEFWGYNDQAAGSLIYSVGTVWSGLLPLLAFGLCYHFYRQARNPTHKKQRKYVTIGFSIPIIAFIVTNMLARGFDIPIPNLGIIATIFFAFFVGYAIIKYELFTLDPALAAENIFSIIPDSLVLADMSTNILRVNRRVVNFFGYTERELLGVPLTQFFNYDAECCKALSELLEKKTITNRELRVQTKTGEKRSVLLSGSVVENTAGGAIGLTCVFHDITERKKASEELGNTKNYLETILNSVQSGIVVIEAKTHEVNDVNSAALGMIGVAREELSGKKGHDHICPSELAKSPITDLGSSIENKERNLLTKDGKMMPILKNVVKLKSDNKVLLIENFMDISERKNMEERLVKAERLASIGELAGQIGHELRNPLSGIKNGVYLIRKRGNDITAEQRGEILKIIDEAIVDSDRIITSLVNYASEIHIQPKQYGVKALVDNALTKVKVPQRITVEISMRYEPEIAVDVQMMETVFCSFIDNAVHAIEQQGTIRIRSQLKDRHLEISFADTGTGIPPNLRDKLFSPLITTKAKGMGMSLAICKRIVEAHNGKIDVESIVGKGTTFTVILPIKQRRGAPKPKSSTPKQKG
jgi:PAS domain S-box-containing protein